jgi:hypothetical protein
LDVGTLLRSHVERCLQDSMDVCRVTTDCDGDYPFEHESAVYYVSLLEAAGTLWVRVWSVAATRVRSTAALLRELNEVTSRSPLVKVVWRQGAVHVEGILHGSAVQEESLGRLCVAVGETSASIGELVAAVHGGEAVSPPACHDGAHG